MIRSTPSSSGSGNITPASTTIVVWSQVSASMFMPNSPSPPSATTSSINEYQGTQRSRARKDNHALPDSAGFASAVGGDTPGGVRSGRWEPPQRLGQAAG